MVRHLLKEGCQGGEKIILVVAAVKPDLVGGQRGRKIGEGKVVVPLARFLGRVSELVLVEVSDRRQGPERGGREAAKFCQVEHVAGKEDVPLLSCFCSPGQVGGHRDGGVPHPPLPVKGRERDQGELVAAVGDPAVEKGLVTAAVVGFQGKYPQRHGPPRLVVVLLERATEQAAVDDHADLCIHPRTGLLEGGQQVRIGCFESGGPGRIRLVLVVGRQLVGLGFLADGGGNRNQFCRRGHVLLDICVQQIDRDFTTLVVVSPLGMVLFVSKYQDMAAMGPQGAMVMIVMILRVLALPRAGWRGGRGFLAAKDKEQGQYRNQAGVYVHD